MYFSTAFLNQCNYCRNAHMCRTRAAMLENYHRTIEFTLSELAQYDGSMGKPAYVAVNGIVYDVSNEKTWGGASHFGLIAGKDLSSQFQGCHGNVDILAKLPKVGVLKK